MKKTYKTSDFVRTIGRATTLVLSMFMATAAFAQPGNDDCASATVITCGQTISGTTTGSTDDAASGAGFCGTSYSGGQGVWYRFAGNDNLVTASVCDAADFDTKISVFSGSCGSLVCVDGNDDFTGCTGNTSEISFVASSGTDYFILVHGFSGDVGDFDLTVTCLPPPSNDLCTSAISLSCGDIVTGNTTLATNDTSLNDCSIDLSTSPGVWYSFVADASGNGVTFSLCSDNTDFDTKMGVFSGSCGALVCEATDDDFCSFFGPSQVSLCTTVPNQTYYVYVTGFGSGDFGNYELTVACEAGNDDCANAIALPTTSVTTFANICATIDGPAEPTACTFFGFDQVQNDIWYSITPQSDCDVTVSLCGSGFDTKLVIYDATSGCPSTESALDCNDDFCSLQSEVTFTPTAGTPYLLRVGGYNGEAGVGILSVSVDDNAAPVIVNCPADVNQTADTGMCGATVSVPAPVFGVDFTDDCLATIENDYNNTSDASDTYPIGTTTVTWTATDVVGNTATCTQTITITDDEGPAMDCASGLHLFSNGPLVNSPGTGVGGADESVLQNVSLGMTTLGSGHQVAFLNRVADDFTISNPNGWTINEIVFYAYQTGSPTTSTITAVNLRIWDGVPGVGSVVFGDTITNLLVSSEWSGIYRVTELTTGVNADRPIMKNTVNIGGLNLPPGTYWLDWQSDGSLGSGPWAPPITINGQTTTGNALQSLNTGAFDTLRDGSTLTAQGLPFEIIGGATFEVDNDLGTCDAALTLPAPVATDCGGVTSLLNDFNSTGDASGTYPVGTTTVNWTAMDGDGNTSTCSYDVVVNDTLVPSISCITAPPSCSTTPSTDVGQTFDNGSLPFGGSVTVTSTLTIPTAGIISDLNVLDMDISHTFINDVILVLTSPNGTSVTLFNQGCFADVDMFMSFDDAGLANGSYPCPPVDGLAYQPDQALSAFNGENMQGVWTLSVTDNFTQFDFGTLNGWSLEICTGGDNTVVAVADSGACDATLSIPAPGVSDNCSGITLVNDFNNTNDASDTYPVGTTLVTWTATDLGGNTATCQMEVTVVDDQDPVIVCPGDISVDNDPGMCDATITYTAPTVSDNCPLPIIESATFTGPTAIPDGDTNGVSIPFIVSGINGTALGTDAFINSVCLEATHTWTGDLIVSIESPNGTVVELINRIGFPSSLFGCGGDDIDACFTTGTGTPAEGVCGNLPALGGSFTAVTDLSALDDGSDPNGTWTIFVSDNEGFDTGQLESITINFGVIVGTPEATQVAGLPSGSVFPVGTTTNTFEITDASGNTSTCSFDVTVTDVEPPVMACVDVTQPNDAGQCDAVVNYVAPVGIDACDTTTLTQSLDHSVTLFNSISCNAGGLHADNGYLRMYDLGALGYNDDFFVHSVTFGVEDATSAGGTGQPVTVNLYTLSGPLLYANLSLVATNTLTVPDLSLALYEFPIQATIPGGSQLVVEVFTPDGQTAGHSFFIGTNGNGQTGTSYITAPTCGAVEPTDYTDLGFPEVQLIIDVNAASVTNQIAGLGSGSTFPVGVTTETYVTTDLHGNSDTCSVMVTVVDTAAPVIACPTSTLSCNTTASTDVGQTFDNPSLPFGGATSVTSTITIGSSGIISDVNVLDMDISHTFINDVILELTSPEGTTVTLFNQGCFADVDMFMSFDDSGLSNGSYPCPPVDGLAYQPDQALSAFNGENMQGVWTLTVTDNFTQFDFGTLNGWSLEICTGGNNIFAGTSDPGVCEGFVTLPPATATDNCPGIIYSNSFNGTADASDSYPVGSTTVELYATDSAGNADTCTIVVFVEDVEDPIVLCPGDSTLANDSSVCGAVFNYTVNASDNCPLPGITVSSDFTGPAVPITDNDPSGISIPFTVSGMPSVLGFDVLFESICLDIDHTWTGDLIVSLQSPNGVTVDLIDQIGVPAGTFGCSGDNIDACFEVGSGNPAENTCSNLPALGGSFTAVTDLAAMNDGSNPNGVWTLFVSDNAGGDLGQVNGFTLNFYDPSQSVTQTAGLASGSVFPVGTTYNEFVVVDAFGNSDTCSFNVTVDDTEAPTWACNSDITVNQQINGVCFAIVNWTPPVASDNCAVDTVYSTHAPGDYFPVGVTTVTYTAEDAAGNSTDCSFNVTVLDVEPPLLTGCPGDMTVSSSATDCGKVVSWTQPTASDNCSGVVLTGTHVPGDFFPIGTTTVMYTATDSSGNAVSCSFDVTVVDDVPPAITCPADIELCSTDTNGAMVSFATPVGTDNCAVDTVVQIAGLPSDTIFPVGVTVVTFEVSDTSGNTFTCSFNVNVKPTPVFTAAVVDVDCNGNGNGSIDVTTSFGTAPFSYSLNGGAPQGSNVFSGLSGGTYDVTVEGADGCSSTMSVTVVEPEPLVVDVDFDIVLCFGDSTGEIIVSATGGTTPYEYSIDGGANYQSGAAFSGLPAGVYAVRVKDANGCTDELSVDITQPAAALTAVVDVDDVLCLGQSNGSVTITASGGTGAYEYSIDGVNYQGSNTIGGLAVGPYDVYVMDANGCVYTESITVGEPSAPLFIDAVNATPVNCYGESNGIITMVASGGTPAYTYSVDGGATYQSSPTFNGLPAATYVLSVQDDNGCVAVDTVDVTTPAPLELDVVSTMKPDCEGEPSGNIMVQGTGGTAPYEYSANGGTPQSSGTFSNLTSGTYTITVTDLKGCTATEVVVLDAVMNLPDASFTTIIAGGAVAFTNTSSNAATYSWNFDDGGTSTDTNPVHTFASSGVYNVSLIASNSCGSDTVIVTMIINTTGIDEADGSLLNIYPNPTPGEFTIEYQAVDNIGNFEVRVVTIDGKLLYQEKANVVGTSYIKRFDKNEYSTGVYVIEILTDTGVHHERLIIEK